MIKRIYSKYESMIRDIINLRIEYHKYRSKCWEYLTSIQAQGASKKVLDKYRVRKGTTGTHPIIIPDNTQVLTLPNAPQLKKEIIRLIAVRAQAIVDSWKEISNGDSIQANSQRTALLRSWHYQLDLMINQKMRFENFMYDWEAMVKRFRQAEVTHRGMKEVLNFIEGKIKLSREQRATIKRLGIDFRYRILGKTFHKLRIQISFKINDIIMDVKAHPRRELKDESYGVPYPTPVTIMAIITLDSLASAVRVFMRDYSYYLDDRKGKVKLLKFNDLYRVTNVAYFVAKVTGTNAKGTMIRFPFVEGWGRHGSVCFGSMDSDIRSAMQRLNFVTLASLFRQWASNFVFGDTNPYTNVNRMYPGIRPEYGALGKELGQDTVSCRRDWISTSSECDKINCILRNGENKTAKCEEYADLKATEEAIEKSEADKKLETPDSNDTQIGRAYRRYVNNHRITMGSQSYNPDDGEAQLMMVSRFLDNYGRNHTYEQRALARRSDLEVLSRHDPRRESNSQ